MGEETGQGMSGGAESRPDPATIKARFDAIAARLGVAPEAIVQAMMERVVAVDEEWSRAGLPGIGAWPAAARISAAADVTVVANVAVDAVSGRVRHRTDAWPAGAPFPLSDQECAALVRGYAVHWDAGLDALFQVPGRWEMIDGYIVARR